MIFEIFYNFWSKTYPCNIRVICGKYKNNVDWEI